MKIDTQMPKTTESILNIKDALKDIEKKGYTMDCPFEIKQGYACTACHQAFPKNFSACPCNSDYTKKHLIRRFKEILKTGKLERNNK